MFSHAHSLEDSPTRTRKYLSVGLATAILATGFSLASSPQAAEAAASPAPPAGYQLISGDWDGDGKDEPGVFHNGVFSLINKGKVTKVTYGWAQSTPVVGDWNGDGKDEVGFFRAGTWYLRSSNAPSATTKTFTFGNSKSVPVVGKWNGKNQGIGVRIGNQFHLRNTATPGPAEHIFAWGNTSMKPVAGDWNRDGRDTIGLHVRGQWFFGGHDLRSPEYRKVTATFGTSSNIPVAGDWDGNGSDTPGTGLGGFLHYRNDLYGGRAQGTIALVPTSSPTVTTPAVSASSRVAIPVPAGKTRVSSPYGMRMHPIHKEMRMHRGVDYAPLVKGARVEILAAADGVVTRSGPVDSFGQWITIRHNIKGVTWTTLYAHEKERFVKVGDTVRAGQPIAIIGSEGDSTGPHLHFQVHKGDYSRDNTVDPLVWLNANKAS